MRFAWIEGKVSELYREIESHKKELGDHGRSITYLVREIALKEQLLKSLQSFDTLAQERFSEEIEKLKMVPGLEKYEIDEGRGKIVFYTLPVHIKHKRKQYEIGRFRIDVGLDGTVLFKNIANTCRYPLYDHPHTRDGEPCLGNLTESVGKLIGNIQVATLAEVLIQYLEIYSEDDAYCKVEYWKEV
ncbi:MAG: hypothetical protein HYY81_03740 [Deltaproteobacteria bacterium]|nr:hypothetical protein [Deltaproteobacteria bacterium]